MRLSSLSRGKQVMVSGALVVGLMLASAGLFLAPQEAEACIPCPPYGTVKYSHCFSCNTVTCIRSCYDVIYTGGGCAPDCSTTTRWNWQVCC